jgi:hypothetical protein
MGHCLPELMKNSLQASGLEAGSSALPQIAEQLWFPRSQTREYWRMLHCKKTLACGATHRVHAAMLQRSMTVPEPVASL